MLLLLLRLLGIAGPPVIPPITRDLTDLTFTVRDLTDLTFTVRDLTNLTFTVRDLTDAE